METPNYVIRFTQEYGFSKPYYNVKNPCGEILLHTYDCVLPYLPPKDAAEEHRVA